MSKEEIERDGNEFFRVKDGKKLAEYEIIDGEVDFTFTAPAYGKYREDMMNLIDGVAVALPDEEESEDVVAPPTPDMPEPEVTSETSTVEAPLVVGGGTPKHLPGCPKYSIQFGDRTPEVIEFARANMSEEEFNNHYKGRVAYEA